MLVASVVLVDIVASISYSGVGVGAIVCAAPYAYCAIVVNPAANVANFLLLLLPPVLEV